MDSKYDVQLAPILQWLFMQKKTEWVGKLSDW